jgi:hypothetical protein
MSAVLADTSVWIAHFREPNPALQTLLSADQVLCHPILLIEIACGTPPAPRERTLSDLRQLRFATVANTDETLALIERELSAPTATYCIYQETLGLTPLAITLIFAIYSLTMVVAFLTVARLSDFVGRKPMILAALLLNALALALFMEANTVTVLMVARAVQGIATGIALATLGAALTACSKFSGPILNGASRKSAARIRYVLECWKS